MKRPGNNAAPSAPRGAGRGFAWRIAWRFFQSSAGGGNRLMSFISLLAITGLVLGIALMITVTAVMSGFDREMQQRVLGVVPHVRLFVDEGIAGWEGDRQQVLSHPGVAAAFPETQVEGLLIHRGRVEPLQLSGYRFDDEDLYPAHVAPGLFDDPAALVAGDGILLGAGLARRLDVGVGDRVSVMIPGEGAGGFRATRLGGFTVAGIITTHTEIDQLLAVAAMTPVAALSDRTYPVHSLRVEVNDVFAARSLGYDLLAELPRAYRFTDWFHTHGNLYQAIRVSRQMVSLLVVLIIAVAAFNVVSMLVMSVAEKRTAIAILKTLGADRGTVMRIFLCQGALIGLGGCLLGGVLGVLLALNISDIAAGLQTLLGMQLLDTQVYPIDYLPSRVLPGDVALVLVSALVLTFLATLYPAWRALKVLPAEELRYE